jgi:hypothetical protein
MMMKTLATVHIQPTPNPKAVVIKQICELQETPHPSCNILPGALNPHYQNLPLSLMRRRNTVNKALLQD